MYAPCATIGLGRAALSRLTDGFEWTVLSVNTDRPLFWFLGNAQRDPPWRTSAGAVSPYTRPILRPVASHASCCVSTIWTPIATCNAWRGIPVITKWTSGTFADGSIDAAYVGSTLGPEQVADEEGFHVLAWVGDYFQIPTVGIAVDETRNPIDSPAVQALVRANQRALKTMADQPDLAVKYIASFLDRMTHQEVQLYYERYIQPYYTSDGRVNIDTAQHAVDNVAAELGVASVAADGIYAPAH